MPALDTPKSIGEFVGEVSDVSSTAFRLYSDVMLNPGDGILFRGRYEVTGTRIERTEGKFNIPASMEGIGKGSKIYRNLNHLFIQKLQKSSDRRQIGLKVTIRAESRGLHAVLRDEQGIESIFQSIGDFPVAEQKMKTTESLRRSVQRSGDSIYKITDVCIEGEEMPFMLVSAMNDFRRRMLENHTAVRVSDLLKNRIAGIIKQKEYPESELGPGANVINRESASFYRNRGVTRIDEAMETADAQSGQCLMRMKYCLKFELEMCERLQKNAKATTQTWLLADHVRRYRLRFHCQTCEMTVETE